NTSSTACTPALSRAEHTYSIALRLENKKLIGQQAKADFYQMCFGLKAESLNHIGVVSIQAG
ncbi:hypothetical protein, partial [Hydrogeniiclostridium mannosilyticum]|uniref:hypothetical protein n=1 Tax=Hydrogeniiclostridium mannosilyticum TaxID=2764322 RepID=UPI00399C1B8D